MVVVGVGGGGTNKNNIPFLLKAISCPMLFSSDVLPKMALNIWNLLTKWLTPMVSRPPYIMKST